jgi:hypothetical protein
MKKTTQQQLGTRALKHTGKPQLAVLTENTIFLSDLAGRIFKHFPNKNFNATPYGTVEFPGDFEAAKAAYFAERAERKAAEAAAREALREAERKKELEAEKNFKSWQRGEKECYVVTSYKWIADDSYNFGKEDYEEDFFYSIEDATAHFDEIVEENKDFCEPGYRFFVEITHLQTYEVGKIDCIDIPVDEREKFESIEGACEEYMQHSDRGGIKEASIDQKIPEDAIVVTSRGGEYIYAHWARFNSYTSDLKPDVDRSPQEIDTVYLLEDLNIHEDYHLLMFLKEELPLTKEKCEGKLDGYSMEWLFEEEEEEEEKGNE